MKWKKCIFEAVDSTNKVAEGQEIGTVVLSKTQTEGRGRYGHTWTSPVGNLYMSAVLSMYGTNTPLMTFVVAVSIVEALKKIDISAMIKWPNDILLNDKKVAGILLECIDDKLIVGVGVNIVSHPTENLAYPATDLKGLVSPEILSDLILETFDEYIDIFETQGFEPIYCKMKSYLKGIG
ncbi:MAG: biotin--[Alphaproteobacteria bacterium]|nr:biotin--[acetyl-CoA-carboxylase] ligase [Alphaproteobacteria bacterium]